MCFCFDLPKAAMEQRCQTYLSKTQCLKTTQNISCFYHICVGQGFSIHFHCILEPFTFKLMNHCQ